MQQPQKHFPVSWDQFHRDARALAWRLAEAGPFKAIVCITRGGMVPAAIVAREIGIRVIETACVASYNHTTQGELTLLKGIAEVQTATRKPSLPKYRRKNVPAVVKDASHAPASSGPPSGMCTPTALGDVDAERGTSGASSGA